MSKFGGLWALPIIALLSACSSGNTPPPPYELSTTKLKEFDDGSGVSHLDMKIKDPSGGVADYVSTGTVLTSDIQNVEADTIYELASTFTEGRTTTSLVHRDKHGRYDRVHKKINGTDYEIIEFARVIPIAESRAHMEAGLEATATSISYAGNSLAVELLVGGGKVSNIPNGDANSQSKRIGA